MTYDYPTNVTGLLTGVEYGNSITEGYLGAAIIFAVFSVTLLSVVLSGRKPSVGLALASFISMVLSIFFLVLGIVSPYVLVISVILLIASIVWLWFGDKVEY